MAGDKDAAKTLECTGQPSQQRIIQPNMPCAEAENHGMKPSVLQNQGQEVGEA